MKFIILIDYANLFINLKSNSDVKTSEEVEHQVIKLLNALKQKLSQPNRYSEKGITVIKTIAFILPDPSFGNPENQFSNEEITVQRVDDFKKTKALKAMNQSRDDDDELMKAGLNAVNSGEVDGVIVISNDGDFSSLAEKIQYIGRYFWAGIYEGKNRASYRLRKVADVVLPLHEIVKGMDEGTALPINETLQQERAEEINTSHLAIYQRGKVIMRYPIKNTTIEIGRRSSRRFHYPQIDLTDYDQDRIVSRQHAKVQPVGNRLLFSVYKECSRGTWRDRILVYPCEQFFIEPDMKIVLGSNNGFGLQYIPK